MKMKDNVFGKSGEPTWTSLAKALRSIKLTSVADKITSDIGIMILLPYTGRFLGVQALGMGNIAVFKYLYFLRMHEVLPLTACMYVSVFTGKICCFND